MSRSHGPTLSRLVQTCLGKECGLDESSGSGLVVAVSGGPDSLALADVLSDLRRKWRTLRLLVVCVDHGLREDGAAESDGVAAFCKRRELPFLGVRVSVVGPGGLQAAAREARYQALEEAADHHFGAEGLIATAHHADDRAETLLLRLLRGVSLEGLGVLPPKDGRRLRPMVRATRKDVLLHCERHQLVPVLDPSNEDPRFLRVRVRKELLPLLVNLSPQVVEALNTLADEASSLGEPSLLSRTQRRLLRNALEHPELALDLPLAGGLRVVRAEDRAPARNARGRSKTPLLDSDGNRPDKPA